MKFRKQKTGNIYHERSQQNDFWENFVKKSQKKFRLRKIFS